MIIKKQNLTGLVLALGSTVALANVELTPTGAEKAGNKDGTIPEWTGGITEPLAGYKKGMFHPDPFADDKPLFTITAGNVGQYADKLSAGNVELFKLFPTTYVMHVYPTHRSAALPQRIYDGTVANEKTAKVIKNGDAVIGAVGGIPFRQPKTGLEVIWNHKLNYQGAGLSRYVTSVVPTVDGSYQVTSVRQDMVYPYYEAGATEESINNVFSYLLQKTLSPPRQAGFMILGHQYIDQEVLPMAAWTYDPQQRRVRRAPQISYDNPSRQAEGLRTNDQNNMFGGKTDRFDWELIGKKEMYIPYNSYVLHSDKSKIADIVRPGHINQDLARFELHRVWEVKATVKAGIKHIMPHRRYYLDEDSWHLAVIDHYDVDGNIWRLSESHSINYYEVPTVHTTLEMYYDFKAKRYQAQGLDNEQTPYDFDYKAPSVQYYDSKMLKVQAQR